MTPSEPAPGDRRRRSEPELGPQVGDESRRPQVVEVGTGGAIVIGNVAGTAVFVAVALAQMAAPDAFTGVLVVLSLVLFGIGTLAFLGAYVGAIARSRSEAIGMGGLFFLVGSAPRRTQVTMLGAWALQIVVAFVAASVGVFTGAAFALLVPMFGIGLSGVWAARWGVFPPKVAPGDRPTAGSDD